MGLCNSTEKAILDRIYGNDKSWVAPTGSFLALSRANPLDDLSDLDEPSNAEYVRQLIQTSGSTTGWSVPQTTGGQFGGYVIYNTGVITFPEATGNWGTISHFVLFNHITGVSEPEAIAWGTLDVAKPVEDGDTTQFPAESLYIRLV